MKIDTSKIEGYSNMSAEEKLAALEGYEISEPDYSGYVKKDVFDKASHELADAKKQLKSKMTEDEQAKAQRDEEWNDLQSKYDKLLHENEVSKYKSKFLAIGYDEKLAEETAEALANGDTDTVFKNQQKNIDAVAKKARSEALDNTPKPTGDGNGKKPMTKEEYMKLSTPEQVAFYENHPEEYKAMYTDNTGGNE